jgi:hypothetical protein
MNQAARQNGKRIETRKALFALIVAARSITGSRTRNVMNASIVNIVRVYVVTP